ncbi:MAG: hypothetical protein Q8Q37_00655 [bacterium]|nr:hypothetical protein [bacterium]
MTQTALVYLINRFFYRLIGFLRHWYVGGFFVVGHRALVILQFLDKQLALKVTFRHWFKPLYQDYTILGYILGLFFRTSRIIIATGLYLIIIVAAAVVYIIWAAAPLYIIYRGVLNI